MISALLFSNLLFANPVPVAPTLDGSYHRECYVVETDALTTDLTIKDNQWQIQHLAYEDERCEQAYLIYEVDYKVKDTNGKIDMTTMEVSYMTLSDEVSRALNMVSYCGFSDWKTKVKKVVSGKLCDEFQAPAVGDVVYSIYSTKQSAEAKTELYLGTMSGSADGKTPQTRYDHVDSLPLVKFR